MTKASKKTDPKVQKESELQQISCIHYPTQFSKFQIETLINLGSYVKAIQQSFLKKQGFYICINDVTA